MRRIVIWGNSCAGKSTLGARLGEKLDIPFIELDAINWQPDWYGLHENDPDRLIELIKQETAGDAWVVAGLYSRFGPLTFWDRLDTVIWLDLPRGLLLRRVLARSWKRWRTRELLWGTNRESFWPHLKVWDQKSLLRWIWNMHHERRRFVLDKMKDPDWSEVEFIHLRSQVDIDTWLGSIR